MGRLGEIGVAAAGSDHALRRRRGGGAYSVLPLSQDHKRLREGDEGPNTGGMGALAPAPVDDQTWLRIRREILDRTMAGLASLLSIAQMPRGVAVGTLAVGEASAANAGHLAAQILALSDAALARRVRAFRARQTAAVLKDRIRR